MYIFSLSLPTTYSVLSAEFMIVPFFIPHSGCPHQCVFCNQKTITGEHGRPNPAFIVGKITEYLRTNAGRGPAELAFYGGSFTALPFETRRDYLDAVQPFIQSGQIQAVRLSTRPDCITSEILDHLTQKHVKTIELGVQSMDDRVLMLSGRGHSAADTVNAVGLMRGRGFSIGLQLMPGLPGDTANGFRETVEKAIGLKPDFVRLYPLLVIRNTPLEQRYNSGGYTPLTLDEAVALCKDALLKFERADIEVIRIGLQSTEDLERPGTILAGPYHPAFRQLVESAILLDMMRAALLERDHKGVSATMRVNPSDLSAAIGQKRANRDLLKSQFMLRDLRILPDASVPKKTVILAG